MIRLKFIWSNSHPQTFLNYRKNVNVIKYLIVYDKSIRGCISNNVGEIPDRVNNFFGTIEMGDVSDNNHPFLNRK